jgi:hypothetical protein
MEAVLDVASRYVVLVMVDAILRFVISHLLPMSWKIDGLTDGRICRLEILRSGARSS